uniref:Glycosyltransferase 2-like domain-containing protein n=1 Tax=viral metagenome TaxID=1070528 RepID=A0A6C0JEI8_9ZZZZ
MKIGVAIPAYNGHIEQLFNLLDSIQNQTVLPDKVVVSCSSTKDSDFQLELYSEKLKQYTFFLEILTTEEKKCAAENRNIAASKLSDMDYITFIDADDVMHPQRIEILLKVFQEHDSDIILHNYYNGEIVDNILQKIENCSVRNNSLKQCYSGCITHKIYNNTDDKIHHGHVSVKQSVFNQIQFPEEPQFYTKEDCVFCYRVFSIPNIKNSYIADELTYYKPSNTQILYFSYTDRKEK